MKVEGKPRVHAAPPEGDELVWVYQYTYWDEGTQSHERSTRFATAEVIKCGLGSIIYDSGKKIHQSSLIDGAFAD